MGLKGSGQRGERKRGWKRRRKKESSLGFPFEIQAVWENGVSEKKTFKNPAFSPDKESSVRGFGVCVRGREKTLQKSVSSVLLVLTRPASVSPPKKNFSFSPTFFAKAGVARPTFFSFLCARRACATRALRTYTWERAKSGLGESLEFEERGGRA